MTLIEMAVPEAWFFVVSYARSCKLAATETGIKCNSYAHIEYGISLLSVHLELD